jgi:DNA repair photolyase
VKKGVAAVPDALFPLSFSNGCTLECPFCFANAVSLSFNSANASDEAR